ncbi:MAG: chemotaxis protein CheW [bacterium]
MAQYTTFYLQGALFGINILHVKELNRHLVYTSVPDGSEYIKGLLNLRGHVVTVFDLAKRLGLSESKINPKTRNLILRTDAETADYYKQGWLTQRVGYDPIGFLVDEIGDVIEVSDDKLHHAPANLETVAMDYVTGVVELEKGLLVVLNIEKIFNIHNAKEMV